MKELKVKDNTKNNTFWWILLLLVIIGSIVYLYFHFHKSMQQTIPNKTISVNVLKIEPQDITIQKKYVGFITPINSVSVLPFISGFIDKVKVSGGQDVKINDILFIIKQDEYKATLDATYAQVLQAKATLENAKLFYERMTNAGARAISKTDLDNAKTSFLSAEAELAQAVANYEKAKIDYNYTVIKATISGIVGDVDITKGDYVSPQGQALLKIIQYNPIRVAFSISDKEYLDEVKLAKNKKPFSDWKVLLRLSNGMIFDKVGKVKFWDNEVTSSTSSVRVFADFENPNKVLYTNAYVDVIMEKNLKNVILVPQSSVYLQEGENYVYIVGTNNKPQKTFVSLGETFETNFIITNGLLEGDKLILNKLSSSDLIKDINITNENQVM
ncbi:MAG: efflux RND transporter periplasmic adaptor subunit [Alphaproteobacteria bacterium]